MWDIEKGLLGKSERFSHLPDGAEIFRGFPDVLFIPELVLGLLVWSVTFPSAYLEQATLIHGWVLGVSLLCFLGTLTLLTAYTTGIHVNTREKLWAKIDVYYHFLALGLYISAGIVIVVATTIIEHQESQFFYMLIAAAVFAFMEVLVYTAHAALSLWRKQTP